MSNKKDLQAKIIELPPEPILLEELVSVVERFGGSGGVIIIETETGKKISTYSLSTPKVRECLSLATYYNEKMALTHPEDE